MLKVFFDGWFEYYYCSECSQKLCLTTKKPPLKCPCCGDKLRVQDRESFDVGYTKSYADQRDVCYIRRALNLKCNTCKYRGKCHNSPVLLSRLNKELSKYGERKP